MTGPAEDLLRFIGSSFRSVWALELILLLKRDRRLWTHDELIETLRASDQVVSQALDGLVAAGLASIEGEGALYMPASEEIARAIDGIEKLYLARPDAVRREIISARASAATAFANSFNLRGN